MFLFLADNESKSKRIALGTKMKIQLF